MVHAVAAVTAPATGGAVHELLLKFRLAQYADAFEAAGYDDADFLMQLSADGAQQVARIVGMKPGHAHRFVDSIVAASAQVPVAGLSTSRGAQAG